MFEGLLNKLKSALQSRPDTKLVSLGELSRKADQYGSSSAQTWKRDNVNSEIELLDDFELSDTAKAAYSALESNVPVVFLTGRAGTGKTTFIRYVRKYLGKNHVVLAPTGIASLNVGGQTIHSFFKFPPRPFNAEEIKDRHATIFNHLKLLIIDEISMVRSDLIDHIDYALRKWRRQNQPFGGVQLLLVGDCLQLPPVVDNDAEYQMFRSKFKSPWFFDAHVFENLPVYAIELTEIYRQRDPHFVDILNRIRINDNHRDAVAELNRRCYRDVSDHDASLILTSTNAQADRINVRNLEELSSVEKIYVGVKEGAFSLSGKRLPAPEHLKLKVGAQVMIIKNIGSAVNGTLGVVTSLLENTVVIKRLDNKAEVTCGIEVWEQLEFRWNSEKQRITSAIVGRYKQIPLILGWAVTIHKSQGLTLDSVKIDLGKGAFAAGQTYVALSRCRTIEKIRLERPISMQDVIADPRILAFYLSLQRA